MTTPLLKPRLRWPFFAKLFIGGYLAVCCAIWYGQDLLIYPGTQVHLSESDGEKLGVIRGMEPYFLDGQFIGFVDAKNAPHPKGTIIVFHGNAVFAADRALYFPALEQRGFRVILYEFPGYGGRPGHPSESQIVQEGEALVKEVNVAKDGPVYVLGESVGTGMAAEVAGMERDSVKGVILITPFDSLVDVAWAHYPYLPIPLMLRDRYDSVLHLAKYSGPVFILQAERDKVVPSIATDRLFTSLGDAKMRLVCPASGHTTWPSEPDAAWWDQAVQFIEK